MSVPARVTDQIKGDGKFVCGVFTSTSTQGIRWYSVVEPQINSTPHIRSTAFHSSASCLPEARGTMHPRLSRDPPISHTLSHRGQDPSKMGRNDPSYSTAIKGKARKYGTCLKSHLWCGTQNSPTVLTIPTPRCTRCVLCNTLPLSVGNMMGCHCHGHS